MAKETLYTAVDIGTSKVCSIVARVGAEGELKVLGTDVAPVKGIQKGCIEDIEDVKAAVRTSMGEAQRYVGRGANPGAYVVISGAHIKSLTTWGSMQEAPDPGGITHEQLQHFVRSALPQLAPGQELLHVIPVGYEVDGLSGVRNPVGLHANNVRMEAYIATGDATMIKNTVKAVESNRIPVHSLVLQSLAAAEATVNGDEREMGVILVDIGYGTTDITLFRNGGPCFSTVLPVGGSQLTRDLAVSERIPFFMAEEAKIKWGCVFPDLVNGDEEVVLAGNMGQQNKVVRTRDLCEPLYLRMLEILKLIVQQVSQAGLSRIPDGGLVLTGGGAEMYGLAQLAEGVMGGPVRIAYPEGVSGLPTQLRRPGFSAGVGALLWGIKHQGERRAYRQPSENSTRGRRSLLSKFRRSRERVPS